MLDFLNNLRHRLVIKFIVSLGLVLLISISVWASIVIEQSGMHELFFKREIIGLAVFIFLLSCAVVFLLIIRFVKQPINKLIETTRQISKGNYLTQIEVEPHGEFSHLARAISEMGREIGEKQKELEYQNDEYRKMFETVPCYITVQDRNYRLIQFNQEFARRFDPTPSDFCYRAYKGRGEKCVICPVEKTFADGRSHQSEESGVDKNGNRQHWLVRTSPIRNSEGEIIAVMEMNLDITERRLLEEELEKSERKYHAIFNNIPNPVFVLDKVRLEILDCNRSVTPVYGYSPEELRGTSFLEMFPTSERRPLMKKLRRSVVINRIKQRDKAGKQLVVNIRVSPSDYAGQTVLLVTTSDITKRLETEQQLIQTSKMATLGEMATGVAHELNQPLAVIKTASNFFMRKIKKKESITDDVLQTMAAEINSHVDRASNIINHMRQFGRKSDLNLVAVDLNAVLKRTFEIFSRQLTVRGIEIALDLSQDLPSVSADPNRLEQVFINLLINARDAIMDRVAAERPEKVEKIIFLHTGCDEKQVYVKVCDSGIGIPQPMREKIFEPFFTTKEVGKGTGLGLSISYGIIKDLKGSIKAEANDSGGACFTIAFPRETA
jgi:histidine kinase